MRELCAVRGGFFCKDRVRVLKRFLLANSMVHPAELIHEGIERTEEGSSSLRAGRESNRILAKVERPSGAGRGRGEEGSEFFRRHGHYELRTLAFK